MAVAVELEAVEVLVAEEVQHLVVVVAEVVMALAQWALGKWYPYIPLVSYDFVVKIPLPARRET